mgnify:CR=1 FL=1
MKTSATIFTLLLSCLITYGQDVDGSKDHTIISRYPDAKIISYYVREYNELQFATKPSKPESAPKDFVNVKGNHTSIVYEIPKGKTTVEVMKNYKDAILKKSNRRPIATDWLRNN